MLTAFGSNLTSESGSRLSMRPFLKKDLWNGRIGSSVLRFGWDGTPTGSTPAWPPRASCGMPPPPPIEPRPFELSALKKVSLPSMVCIWTMRGKRVIKSRSSKKSPLVKVAPVWMWWFCCALRGKLASNQKSRQDSGGGTCALKSKLTL